MKKLLRFLFSMKFALILLGILLAACVAGSVIPQKEAASYYMSAYSQQAGGAILALGLNDVFHCPWFVLLAVVLCLNLLGCNLVRFPALLRRTGSGFTPEKYVSAGRHRELLHSTAPEALFTGSGFRNLVKGTDTDGREILYSVKNKAGLWGAWLCHLGMLIVIIGFGLGQMRQEEYAVYGVPGQTKPVEGTPYELTVDDFEVALREDDTVEQYTASITMKDTRSGETQSGQTSVNHPTSLFGMRCYQNSTGWAANVQIYRDEDLIQETVLCAGEYVDVEDKEGLSLVFAAFYPDYVQAEDGTPRTASSKLNNPAYLYRLYYQNEILGMNVLMAKEVITVDAYTIIFKDPQNYTLIQIKRDPFTWLAAIGAVIVMIGLILAFYLRTAEVYAVKTQEGDWSVSGYSRKGGAEFADMLKEKQKELEPGRTDPERKERVQPEPGRTEPEQKERVHPEPERKEPEHKEQERPEPERTEPECKQPEGGSTSHEQ